MSKIKVGDWVTVNDVTEHPDVTEFEKYMIDELHESYVVIRDDVNTYHEINIDDLTLEPKTTPRPHAELIKRWADDDKMIIEHWSDSYNDWYVCVGEPMWYPDIEYREKPSEPTERDLIMKEIREAQDKLKDAEKRLQEIER